MQLFQVCLWNIKLYLHKIYPPDESNRLLRNVITYIRNYTASHPEDSNLNNRHCKSLRSECRKLFKFEVANHYELYILYDMLYELYILYDMLVLCPIDALGKGGKIWYMDHRNQRL
jgi:hypothetical protein